MNFKSCYVLFALLAFSLLRPPRTLGQETPIEVVNYVDRIGQIKTIEYSCKIFRKYKSFDVPDWIPSAEGRYINSEVDARHDLVGKSYWERKNFYPLNKSGVMRSLQSIHAGKLRGYYDDDSEAFAGDGDTPSGISEASGTNYEDEMIFIGPEFGAGLTYSHRLGAGAKSLGELLAECQTFTVVDGGVTALDLFGTKSNIARYEMDLKFDEIGRLISFSSFNFDFKTKERTFVHQVKVDQFVKVDDFWLPTEFSSKLGKLETTYHSVIPDSIVVNRSFSDADFVVDFPKTKRYYDEFTGKTMQNGQEVVRAEEPLPSQRRAGLFSFLMCAIGIIALLVFVLRKRSSAKLMSIAGCMTLVAAGCNQSSVTDGNSLVFENLLRVEANEITCTTDVGETGRFQIQLENVSDQHITLDSNLVSSCGCAGVELSANSLPPGTTAEILGEIVPSFHPEKRSVSILMYCNEPKHFIVPFHVLSENVGDWAVSGKSINSGTIFWTKGTLGNNIVGEFSVDGSPEVISLLEVTPSNTSITLAEIKLEDKNKRGFVVTSNLQQEIGQKKEIAEIRISSPTATPRKIALCVNSEVTSPCRWFPPLASIQKDVLKRVSLNIDKDCRLLEVSTTGDFELEIEPHGNAQDISFMPNSNEDALIEAVIQTGTMKFTSVLQLRAASSE